MLVKPLNIQRGVTYQGSTFPFPLVLSSSKYASSKQLCLSLFFPLPHRCSGTKIREQLDKGTPPHLPITCPFTTLFHPPLHLLLQPTHPPTLLLLSPYLCQWQHLAPLQHTARLQAIESSADGRVTNALIKAHRGRDAFSCPW